MSRLCESGSGESAGIPFYFCGKISYTTIPPSVSRGKFIRT